MTQEERRALFHKKAEIGNRRNNAALKVEEKLFLQYWKTDLTVREVITLAWAAGCDYGKEHAEELKIFDHEED